MKKKHWMGLFILLLAAASCSGGGSQTMPDPSAQAGEGKKQYVIGVSIPTTDLAFRRTMFEMVKEAYPEGNTDKRAQVLVYDGKNSQKQQNQDIKDLIEQGVDSIVVDSYTTEGILSVIKYANERGVPIMAVDDRMETNSSAQVVSFVGSDHTKMGNQAAEMLLRGLKETYPEEETWNVLELTGIPGSAGAMDRGEGIHEVLDQEERVHLLGSYNGEFAEENAASIMEDCLGVYDEIHAVICQNDLMAEGCYREIEKAGKVGEILIVGFDGQRSVVEKIREGGIYGTVLEPPDMAVTAVEKLCDYLDGEELSPVYYQESIPIYPEDAERFLKENLAW